jgi:MFS family permease
MVMIMFCGFSIGAALGGLLAADLIPRFGWRAVFLVGGVAPLLMVPLLVSGLPESVRFLEAIEEQHGRAGEQQADLETADRLAVDETDEIDRRSAARQHLLSRHGCPLP